MCDIPGPGCVCLCVWCWGWNQCPYQQEFQRCYIAAGMLRVFLGKEVGLYEDWVRSQEWLLYLLHSNRSIHRHQCKESYILYKCVMHSCHLLMGTEAMTLKMYSCMDIEGSK